MVVRKPVRAAAAAVVLGCAGVLAWSIWPHPAGPRSGAGAPVAVASTVAGPGAPWSGSPTVALPSPTMFPAAGALFDGDLDDFGAHFCSGAVLDSPTGDVVLTAAHCVSGGDGSPVRTGMVFVPGYHDGVAPFGAWTVSAAVVDPRWQATGDPDRDVAFLTVTRAGAGPVQALTGGYRLVTDPGSVNDVRALGYPVFSDAPLVRSGATTRASPTQLELDAPGLYDGTSGGPWVRDGDEVIAVTGGFEQGGLAPDVSYASYLDDSAGALLDQLPHSTPP